MYLLQRPHLSAKAARFHQSHRYTFIVPPHADKISIKKEINARYQVTVTDVNTMRCAGKKVRRHTRKGLFQGQRASYKKALITLRPGQLIELHNEPS